VAAQTLDVIFPFEKAVDLSNHLNTALGTGATHTASPEPSPSLSSNEMPLSPPEGTALSFSAEADEEGNLTMAFNAPNWAGIEVTTSLDDAERVLSDLASAISLGKAGRHPIAQ
jgi:hypothetical protein